MQICIYIYIIKKKHFKIKKKFKKFFYEKNKKNKHKLGIKP